MPPTASPWTAVIAAAAALLGVLLGQLLQTRREDRNWRRQREDQRRRDVALWDREDRHRFTDTKREIYAKQLEALRAFRDAAMDQIRTIDTARRAGDDRDPLNIVGRESMDSCNEKRDAARSVHHELMLVASEPLIEAVTQRLLLIVDARSLALFDGEPIEARAKLNAYDNPGLVKIMREDLSGKHASA